MNKGSNSMINVGERMYNFTGFVVFGITIYE
jgi:hypothetical protein